MSLITKVIKTKTLSSTKDLLLNIKIADKFYLQNLSASLNENEYVFNGKLHTIKSLDGIDLKAYEELIDSKNDFVVLVNNCDGDLNSLDETSNYFLKNNVNVIRLNTRRGLFNYSKTYLDIASLLNYFKEIYPNNRIYLYGYKAGANMCAATLQLNIKDLIDVVVLDNIELDYIYKTVRDYCTKNKVLYTTNVFNRINKLAVKNSNCDLNTFVVDNVLKNNEVPVVFIENTKESKKRFLKFYNSSKACKKILYIENDFDRSMIDDAYSRLIAALRNLQK